MVNTYGMISPMFKPIRKKTFLRDFTVIQVGFAIFGTSIAMIIRANLGTNPFVILEVALSQITGLTSGTLHVIVGFLVPFGAIIMREKNWVGNAGEYRVYRPLGRFGSLLYPID